MEEVGSELMILRKEIDSLKSQFEAFKDVYYKNYDFLRKNIGSVFDRYEMSLKYKANCDNCDGSGMKKKEIENFEKKKIKANVKCKKCLGLGYLWI